jgi:intraflagellar transport protein 172
MNPHLISVRINEPQSREDDVKKIAYLVDLQTIHIIDLVSGQLIASISHDSKIDWLELSIRGNRLLFRDRKKQLFLYNIQKATKSTLLNFCSYVQWVPNSDVVVAQSRNNLCIWYSIDSPERVTLFPIKGDIHDIERVNGKTEVLVDEGVNTVSYTLDEDLIEFESALETRDYDRALNLLETLELTPETEAMWKSLSIVAFSDQNLAIAERCCAALGDIARSRYLQKINESTETMVDDIQKEFFIKSRLAILDREFTYAERLFLEQNEVQEAMDMYQGVHKWEEAIKVAEIKNHPDLDQLKKNYFQWLIDSGQEEKAGKWKEEENDLLGAINLYLKGGMPAKAAQVIRKGGYDFSLDLIEKIATTLFQNASFEEAGKLYEQLGNHEKALDSYKRGKAFRAAIDLSRIINPEQVVKLEENWGDYLSSQKQYDAAISHFIEAGKSVKAVDSAINAKQWKRAIAILDSLSSDAAKPYFIPIAKHFASVKDYENAEKYFVRAKRPQEAVDMYTKANRWDKAHSIAMSYMKREDVAALYISQAKELEAKGQLREAEELYITIGEPDLAISMFKNHKEYDHMIRLVTAHHKNLVAETHCFLAKSLESEANFKKAEYHYLEGNDWKSAVNMYCANSMYEEAHRVYKANQGS